MSRTTDRIKITWAEARPYLDFETTIYDAKGAAFRRAPGVGDRNRIVRVDPGHEGEYCWAERDDICFIDPPGVPEPPDGSRIEFVHNTDRYGAWRDDLESRKAGWRSGDGGITWCLYGQSVPFSWAMMWLQFGNSLRHAYLLETTGRLDAR